MARTASARLREKPTAPPPSRKDALLLAGKDRRHKHSSDPSQSNPQALFVWPSTRTARPGWAVRALATNPTSNLDSSRTCESLPLGVLENVLGSARDGLVSKRCDDDTWERFTRSRTSRGRVERARGRVVYAAATWPVGRRHTCFAGQYCDHVQRPWTA